MKIGNEFWKLAAGYGFWGLFLINFVIFGLKHIPATIREIGNFFNNRLKIKQSHEKAMKKIGNQNKTEHSKVTGKG